MKTLIFMTMTILVSEGVFAQNEKPLNKVIQFTDSIFSFKKIQPNILNNVNIEIELQNSLVFLQTSNNTSNGFKISNDFLQNDIIYKNYSNLFINHCGYLENGLNTNYSSKDLLIGNIMDNIINNFLLRKLFIKD